MNSYIHRFEPLWGVWKVEQLLGEGSYGRVWQVRRDDMEGACLAAVKEIVIPSSKGNLTGARAEGMDVEGAKVYFREVLKKTLEEVELMRHLADCANIVGFEEYQVRELNQEDEFGWVLLIRMERLQPFKSRLLEKELTLRDALRLGIHICRALEACSERGIVHRDIKPDNLFYCEETDTYKLGDFGIAHYLARPTEGKGRAGTLSHMPPEVFQGAEFTYTSDLYALGMILYRLMNDNRIPLLPPYPENFTPQQRDRALVERLNGREPGPPRLAVLDDKALAAGRQFDGIGIKVDTDTAKEAAELGRIAWKAIGARPEKRFVSAAELREALEAVCLKMTSE